MKSSLLSGIAPSAYYITNFITEAEENLIIDKVNNVPKPKWTQLSNRRLQNWGGIPHPKGMISENIPSWLQDFVDRVASVDFVWNNCTPNHVLINEYLPGQGIMPHFDGPLFYPTIATISCGSHTLLNFTKPNPDNAQLQLNPAETKDISILLEPRSLLLLQDSMYHEYQHCIEEVDRDIVTQNIVNLDHTNEKYHIGQILSRSTRLSLTIRHVPKTTKLKINLGR